MRKPSIISSSIPSLLIGKSPPYYHHLSKNQSYCAPKGVVSLVTTVCHLFLSPSRHVLSSNMLVLKYTLFTSIWYPRPPSSQLLPSLPPLPPLHPHPSTPFSPSLELTLSHCDQGYWISRPFDESYNVLLDHTSNSLTIDGQNELARVNFPTVIMDTILSQLPDKREQSQLRPAFHIEAEMPFSVPGYETFLKLDAPMLFLQRFLPPSWFWGHGGCSVKCGTPLLEVVTENNIKKATPIWAISSNTPCTLC